MRRVILNIGWEVDRIEAFALAGQVFAQMETAPCCPKPDFPIVITKFDLKAACKITKAGNHVITIRSK